jgi:hypothetical protein
VRKGDAFAKEDGDGKARQRKATAVLETQRGATESGSELQCSSSSVLFGRFFRPNPPLPRCCYPLSLFYATYMFLFNFFSSAACIRGMPTAIAFICRQQQ